MNTPKHADMQEVKYLVECIVDAVKDEFLTKHPHSYLVASMTWDSASISIEAPRYNMAEVAKKGLSALRFRPGTSYATELDRIGSYAMAKLPKSVKGSYTHTKVIRRRVYTGNTRRFTMRPIMMKDGTYRSGPVKKRKIVRKDGRVVFRDYRNMIVVPHWRIERITETVGNAPVWQRIYLGNHRDYIRRDIHMGITKWARDLFPDFKVEVRYS